MDFVLITLCLLVVASSLALWTNRARDVRQFNFELEPNCLLTRWPILFVTGPRSFFYFARYWNLYPVFLAEHGYEVYTLHLPWKNKALRLQRLKEFIHQQDQLRRHFHLFLDSASLSQFEGYFKDARPSCVQSLTEIAAEGSPEVIKGLTPYPIPLTRITTLSAKAHASLLSWAFDLHRLLTLNSVGPTLSSLGAQTETALSNSVLLLTRARDLAEEDVRES